MTAKLPVYDGYFADPFVWRHGGTYYAAGTGGAEVAGVADGTAGVISRLRSPDLHHWEQVGTALVRPDRALGTEFWAPAMAFGNDGIFYLYYSVGQCLTGDIPHQLRVAVSDRPEGPYLDTGEPLLLLGNENFVFDPHPFRDTDGAWYLFYNRNYLDTGEAGRAGDAIAARRLLTMTTLSAETVSIVRPDADWQRGPARVQNGQVIDWHTAEGGCVIERYGIDCVVSSRVLGPDVSISDKAPPRVLKSGTGGLIGPGHNSVIAEPDGTDHLVFHAWDAAMTKRQMYIEPLHWTPDGLICP